MTFWERFLANLKVNRCPILDPEDKAKQEQQDRINRLYPQEQMTLNDLNNSLKTPSAEIGARLRAFALRLAPAVAATYTAGYVTGQFLHSLNDKLVEFTR